MKVQRALAAAAATLLLSAAASIAAQGTSSPQKSRGSRYVSSKSSGKHRKARRQRGQKVPTAARIREIQAALAHEGVYQGEPTGKWDPPSAEAMKKFQAAHHLPVTGKLDALSLQKLGFGSGVAGQAPPRPSGMPAPASPTRLPR